MAVPQATTCHPPKLGNVSRCLALGRHGKRLYLTWQPIGVLATDATNVVALEDDHCAGVLVSRAHGAWAWAQSSTIKGDLRYTPTSVLLTFPWPDPVTPERREGVAAASRSLFERRSESCTTEQIGLTKLYNAVDEGACTDLAGLHRELDVAGAVCYGWPASVAQDDAELVRRLTDLNREIAEGRRS